MKIAWIVAAMAAVAVAGQEGDEKKEPPMLFAMEVDGKRVPVELDKSVDLPTSSGPVKVTLRAEPHRVFTHGGMKFHYPRGMGFEADFKTAGVRSWCLDGNDVVLTVHRQLGVDNHEELREEIIKAMMGQYGPENVKSARVGLKLQGKEWPGTKLTVTLVGSRFTQAIHSYEDAGDTVILILQDMLDDKGTASQEFREFLKMFQESFKFQAVKK